MRGFRPTPSARVRLGNGSHGDAQNTGAQELNKDSRGAIDKCAKMGGCGLPDLKGNTSDPA